MGLTTLNEALATSAYDKQMQTTPFSEDTLAAEHAAGGLKKENESLIYRGIEIKLSQLHDAVKHQFADTNLLDDTAHLEGVSRLDKALTNRPSIIAEQTPLAIEAAVAIVINGIHYAVLMASPNHFDELALGFLFSEGLIEKQTDLLDWACEPIRNKQDLLNVMLDSVRDDMSDGRQNLDDSHINAALLHQLHDYTVYVLTLRLTQRCHQRILAQRRQLSGRTGCGMCGITGLSQALPNLIAYKQSPTKPDLQTLLRLREQMQLEQQTHQLTGSVHAAATVISGQWYVFEDVGRHNALDKLIGYLLQHRLKPTFVVMTSRLSVELVQKAIRFKLPWLIGMSAPTSTAVKVASRYGLGLAGFLRDNRVTYYN